jgi:OFA family oxalate/formate antiporter-like MFS transporter
MGQRESIGFSRWWLILAGAAAMGIAGTYQFVWSSIRDPLGLRLGVGEASLGAVFTIFVVAQTLSQFPAGWVRDRYGPRVPLLGAAVLLAAGFALAGLTTALPVAYLAFAAGGLGSGIAYTVAINTPVKWFDDRRGLATGVVGMAYGGTSFLLIPLIRGRIDAAFSATLLGLAAVAAVVTLLAVPVLRDPDLTPDGAGAASDGTDPETTTREVTDADDRGTTGGDAPEAFTWREAVRTWQFWVLYGAFVIVNGVGLMLIGKVVSLAGALGLPAAAATGSASFIAVSDAVGVVLGGAASDRFGNERTVAVGLVCSGLALALAVGAGRVGSGLAFVALVGAVAFFRSPTFAIVPGIVGRYYGRARSSENYAVLYTAKLWGGVGGGVLASLAIAVVGWTTAFLGGAALLALAGVGVGLLRPVD